MTAVKPDNFRVASSRSQLLDVYGQICPERVETRRQRRAGRTTFLTKQAKGFRASAFTP
jgi:hypothetical protein